MTTAHVVWDLWVNDFGTWSLVGTYSTRLDARRIGSTHASYMIEAREAT